MTVVKLVMVVTVPMTCKSTAKFKLNIPYYYVILSTHHVTESFLSLGRSLRKNVYTIHIYCSTKLHRVPNESLGLRLGSVNDIPRGLARDAVEAEALALSVVCLGAE